MVPEASAKEELTAGEQGGAANPASVTSPVAHSPTTPYVPTPTPSPSSSFAASALFPFDVLLDCAMRYVWYLPVTEIESFERLIFHCQDAYFYYVDMLLPAIKEKVLSNKATATTSCIEPLPPSSMTDPTLNEFTVRLLTFATSLTQDEVVGGLDLFAEYQKRICVCGTVIFDYTRTHILLVCARQDSWWVFPKGKMGADETPLECAIREAWEEIGVDIRNYLQATPVIDRRMAATPVAPGSTTNPTSTYTIYPTTAPASGGTIGAVLPAGSVEVSPNPISITTPKGGGLCVPTARQPLTSPATTHTAFPQPAPSTALSYPSVFYGGVTPFTTRNRFESKCHGEIHSIRWIPMADIKAEYEHMLASAQITSHTKGTPLFPTPHSVGSTSTSSLFSPAFSSPPSQGHTSLFPSSLHSMRNLKQHDTGNGSALPVNSPPILPEAMNNQQGQYGGGANSASASTSRGPTQKRTMSTLSWVARYYPELEQFTNRMHLTSEAVMATQYREAAERYHSKMQELKKASAQAAV